MMFKNFVLFLVFLVLIGCGTVTTDGGTEASTGTQPSAGTQTGTASGTQTETVTVTLSGTVTYDFVPFKSGGNAGLDYDNITQKPVRGAVVDIVNSSGSVLATTNTNSSGNYSVSVTGSNVKVRVSARLYKAASSGQSSWDFQVKDNTNSDALYVMEGSLAGLGTGSTQTRNLNASSGWGGSSYTSTRTAAPFAILDVVYLAIQKVTSAQNDAVFSPLNLFWSKNNIASSGTKSLGQITTSHYDGTALYILGKEDSDTDEYDTAIVGHEWGHYYENIFSRADNIGGSHGTGDMIDIRVAFGEGFGTFFGCMVIGSPIYVDSSGFAQGSTQVYVNIEEGGSRSNPGWYSEASIYSILYDVYDSDDDRGDTLSLGFTPMHHLLIDAEKNTAAFTSIFTFIAALKEQHPEDSAAIDAITSNESIAPITDIYGTGRTNRATQNANPLYASLSVGSSVNIVTNYTARASSASNVLGAYNFVKFNIPSSGTYTFNISQVGGSGTPDPDMYIYTGSSNQPIASAEATGSTDSITTTLNAGTYRMAVIVYNQSSGATFNITLN